MDSLGISESFKPTNREFLFYHRDKEREKNEKTTLEDQKGEAKSIATEICSTLNEIPNKIAEFPIILIDKRDHSKNADSKKNSIYSNVEHPCLQLYDKKYPPITHTLNSFINSMNNNNSNNNNSYESRQILSQDNQKNPLYLLNLMKSKNKNCVFKGFDQGNRNSDILMPSDCHSMTSYCEMVNASDMFRNSMKYNEKFGRQPQQPDVFQRRNRKNMVFDSSINLCGKKSSLKDFMIQAESYSNLAKSYLLQENQRQRDLYKPSQQEFALKYMNSFDSMQNTVENSNYNQNNNMNSQICESNLMKASKLHQMHKRERQLFGNDDFNTNKESEYTDTSQQKYLYPYVMDESVLFKKFMKNSMNNKKSTQNENNVYNYLLGFQIILNSLKNLLLVLILLFFIWPLTVFMKFCWLITKNLSKNFPNLEDVCEQFDSLSTKLLFYENKLMDSISGIKI